MGLKFLDEATKKRIEECRLRAHQLDAPLRAQFESELREAIDRRGKVFPLHTRDDETGKMIEVGADEYFRRKYSIAARFESTLDYLAEYANRAGCTYDRSTGADTECRIGLDFAPLSFGFAMFKRRADELAFSYWFQGGLIYHGPRFETDGNEPTFSISLGDSNAVWSIHT